MTKLYKFSVTEYVDRGKIKKEISQSSSDKLILALRSLTATRVVFMEFIHTCVIIFRNERRVYNYVELVYHINLRSKFWVIFRLFKLCIALERPSFKWVKISI